MCVQQKKYGFMLITHTVYKYIMYLISSIVNLIKIPTFVLLNYPEIAKMRKMVYRLCTKMTTYTMI